MTEASDATAQPATGSSGSADKIWSGEYWAKKGAVSLYMFRKRLGEPRAGEPPRPVLFLVHGSSISARPSFDLTVPGGSEYSMMNVFVRHGFDVWTMDHEGYGRSARTDGNSDIASGVEDLKAATEVVARETGRARFHFYGPSSGALRAGAFAMACRIASIASCSRLSRGRARGPRLLPSAPRASSTTAPTVGAPAGVT